MIKELESYQGNKELLRLLTDPVKKTEYTIRDKMDEEIIYQMSLRSAESYLMYIWKILHGLPLNAMPDSNDLEVMQYFYQNSELWFRQEQTPIDSNLFIGRFLTEIALYIANHLDKMIVDYVIYTTKDIQVVNKIDMLDQIIACFAQLARNMICGKSYTTESDKLFEMATLCSEGGIKRRTKLIRIYNTQMNVLRDMSKNGWLGSDFLVEDSIIINNIVLLAYMVVTEDPKATEMFSVGSKITFDDNVAVKKVVIKLGVAILDYKHSVTTSWNDPDREVFSKLYAIFIRCKPMLKYRFSDIQKDEYLREGCRALSYLGFLSQSKIVMKILGKMIY